jgi:hypothetical protein
MKFQTFTNWLNIRQDDIKILMASNESISENLQHHIENNLEICDNIFRPYSKTFFDLIKEAKELYYANLLEVTDDDADLLESDIGEMAEYNGETVFLDLPFIEEGSETGDKKVSIGKPFRTPGANKKFAVYVKSKSGRVKKVRFGDPNMKIRASNPARRKSFAARHKCSQKKDKTTAGYWSCRSHRMKSLGTHDKGKYW